MKSSSWASFGRRLLSRSLLITLVFSVLTTVSSPAQTLNTLVNLFGVSEPFSPVTQGSDGYLYGTASQGGNFGFGVIFKMTRGVFSVITNFDGTNGAFPETLTQGIDGSLYGTTYYGGANNDGTVFKINSSGALTTLHNFNGADGNIPNGGLVQASDGNFYGTTSLGGASGFGGTVYRITPGGTLTTLYDFCSQSNCADGNGPMGVLVQGTDGNLYGTTSGGGANGGYGTVFKITLDGVLTTLHAFNFTDGSAPFSGLVQATDGNFYGITAYGGPNSTCPNANVDTCGTIFKITAGGTFTMLYNFAGTDGATPQYALMQAIDGNIYGTTTYGGTSNHGTAFKITLAGELTSLHSFCSATRCSDGDGPTGLVQGNDGRVYGTTSLGGDTGCNIPHGCGTVFEFDGITPTATEFVPVNPCRLADTREGSPIQAGTWNVFAVPQLGNCNIPSGATAYSLNVTVVPHQPLRYLTIWPAEKAMPAVSTMNSPDSRIKANAAVVPAGADGAVSVYVTDTSDVLLDIDGYFTTPGSETLQFYPLTPCRIVDTRNGQNGGSLQAGVERDYPITGSCGIPAGAKAYSFNVTAIPAPGGLDYLTVWPQGEQRPGVSTLNDRSGTVVANAAIVSAGSNQAVAFYANSNDTDLLLDVNGYFAPPGIGGSSFYSVPPCRAYDSRKNNGQPFQGERTLNIVNSQCATRTMARAYLFNATVVPSPTLGYLTLWADGQTMPGVSTLNAYDGFITSNMAIVPNMNGSIDAYASGLTQLILDISGYFAR